METTLREQIKKSGLKQNYIAKRLSISKEHLNRMLKDNEVPNKYKIEIVRLLSNVE